jgi:hypothetical protein
MQQAPQEDLHSIKKGVTALRRNGAKVKILIILYHEAFAFLCR